MLGPAAESMMRIGLVQCAWVGAGGMVGSILRFVIHTLVQRTQAPGAFPWGTLAVNAVGCLAIGMLAGWPGAREVAGDTMKLFVVIGLFGGFTTFSAFGIDTFELLHNGAYGAAATNVVAQVGLGILSVAAGFAIGKAF